MSRPLRIGLGLLLGVLAVVGFGIGFTLLVGGRPDIGNPDLATVKTTLPGTWNLKETSQADFIAGLVDEFPAADLRDEMTRLHIGDPVNISLTFTDTSVFAASKADGAPIAIGDGTYKLTDNHTMRVTRGDCDVAMQFVLHDAVLTFGVVDQCPTQLSDLTLAVLLRGGPFTRATAP